MRGTLLLAWRYVVHHRARSILLVLAVGLAFFLPLAVQLLIGSYTTSLAARAAATPLVLGARGSRFDLVLNALYFQGRVPRPLPMAEVERINAEGLARAIPLRCARTARGYSVVGTTPDYFACRGLAVAAGELPLVLGEAVAGATVAAALGLAPGATLMADRGSLYDLAAAYPLRMRVTGVLAPADSPDDGAVFVDVRTAWILDGIGHGHEDAAGTDPSRLLHRDPERVVLDASVVEYTDIRAENVQSFHFHGDPATFPLTAALVLPRDDKGRTLLKGRYASAGDLQLLVPAEVVDEILGFLLQVKRFLDANLVLVLAATLLFLALIVLLSLRARQGEMATLSRIGAPRRTVVRLLATELALVLVAGCVLAGILAAVCFAWLARAGLPLD